MHLPVCVSLSLYAYIMNENVLGGLGTSNRTELGATFVFVFFFDKCCHFLTNFFWKFMLVECKFD